MCMRPQLQFIALFKKKTVLGISWNGRYDRGGGGEEREGREGGERTLWMKGWHPLDERGRKPSGWRGWYPLDRGEGLSKSKGLRFCVLKAAV